MSTARIGLRGLSFVVPGKAQPAGSKRAFPFKRRDGRLGVAVSDDNPRAKDWKALVSQIAAEEMLGHELLDCPLVLRVTFCIERPRSHYGSGRNSAVLKPGSPNYHAQRPDLLKLLRGLEDALTGIAWRDDSQIVRHEAQKVWMSRHETIVEIEEAIQ